MSIASRHRKLTLRANDDDAWWRRREDLLTADVFGAFRYLPPELGLLPFLASATNVEGLTLEEWAGAWRSIQGAEICFWPALEDRREPDLLIALRASKASNDLLVLVEAKLHGGMGTIEGRSQLGHYGKKLLDDDFELPEGIEGELPARRVLLYLTKDRGAPKGVLPWVRGELSEESQERTEVFWVSWHYARAVAASALAAQREADGPAHVLALLDDLVEDLAERGFTEPRERLPWPLRLPAGLDRGVEEWLRGVKE